MNKVVLIGRITKEPEIKYTQNGTGVVSFTLAVDRDDKDNNTDFINCVAWGHSAEFIANYIKKGYLLAVSGQIQTRTWQNSANQTVYVTEVVLDTVKNLTPKEQSKPQPNNTGMKVNGQSVSYENKDDGLPF